MGSPLGGRWAGGGGISGGFRRKTDMPFAVAVSLRKVGCGERANRGPWCPLGAVVSARTVAHAVQKFLLVDKMRPSFERSEPVLRQLLQGP